MDSWALAPGDGTGKDGSDSSLSEATSEVALTTVGDKNVEPISHVFPSCDRSAEIIVGQQELVAAEFSDNASSAAASATSLSTLVKTSVPGNQNVPKQMAEEQPPRSGSSQVWGGVPRSGSSRNRVNLFGRSLSETAINMRHVESPVLDNCTIAIDYGHGDSRIQGNAIPRRVNDVFVNILHPLDQPPSYDFVCKTYKLSSNSGGVLPNETTAGENNSAGSGPPCSRPPTYREATADGRYLEDAPPTYHSLFTASMLRAMQPFTGNEASSAETGNGHRMPLARRMKIFSCRIVLLTIVIGFILVMPLCMITVGVATIHKCPVQPRIPIYLIVLGIFQMLECCVRLGYNFCRARVAMDVRRERFKNKDPLVYFMVVWFVVGSMWVYQTPTPCFTCIPRTVNYHLNTTSPRNTNISESRTLLESILNRTVATTVTALHTDTRPTLSPAVERYCDATVYSLAFWIVTAYYSTVGMICVIVILDAVLRILGKCCCNRSP